jgi:uncharacterized membrane protein YfcA
MPGSSPSQGRDTVLDVVFTLWVAGAALVGGTIGALLGLGGGIIIVPIYTLVLGLPPQIAVGTSLVAVVANASSAATIYLKARLTNLRVALILATVTATGSLGGGLIGTSVTGPFILAVFGFVLVGAGILMLARPESGTRTRAPEEAGSGGSNPLEGRYFDSASRTEIVYRPKAVRSGLLLSLVAGLASGLLGIGGGIVQVPVMNLMLGMPMKAAIATSSHIISLTAVAGAVVYLARGFVDPVVTAVTILGVFAGARMGARLAQVLPGALIKRVFAVVLFYMALRMLATVFGWSLLS